MDRSASLPFFHVNTQGWAIWTVLGAGGTVVLQASAARDLFTNLIVGVIGSFLGAFIAGRLHIPIQGLVASFVVSTLGALLLLSVLVLVRRR